MSKYAKGLIAAWQSSIVEAVPPLDKAIQITTGNGDEICLVRMKHKNKVPLLVAAPELLEVAKSARDELQGAGDEQRRILDARWRAIDMLNAAIAKAKGGGEGICAPTT